MTRFRWPTLDVHRRFVRHVADLDLDGPPSIGAPVTEEEVQRLPRPAQRYLHFMGVVGRPRCWSLRVRFCGKFRLKESAPWSPFDAWQLNVREPVARLMEMRIDVGGRVPMVGSDTYVAGRGRMRGKLLDLIPVADGKGTEFDLGELVTYVNDAILLAPSMLLVPAARWQPVDDRCFAIVFADAGKTVTARVSVDEAGAITDFRTEDRWFAGGSQLVRLPWSTPVSGWRTREGQRMAAGGSAVWHFGDHNFEYIRGTWLPETIERTEDRPA